MNRDVFLSLLALDAYNRGYGQNVLLRKGDQTAGQNELNRCLGNAVIIEQSNTRQNSDAVNAGFYAIAYDWNGERVISYRGTNPRTPPVTPAKAGVQDNGASAMPHWIPACAGITVGEG